jgi:signal peptidase I
MCKHVQKLLNHQRDILTPQEIAAVQSGIASLRQTVAGQGDPAALEKEMTSLEGVANKWFKPYPDAAWRENVEVLLVALTVAMGIRTFFLQPFKIPTGSMQPTLYGVTSSPDFTRDPYVDPAASKEAMAKVEFPTGWERVRQWFAGVSYLDVRAKVDGQLERVNKPFGLPIFYFYQTLVIGGKTHYILFPPDYGSATLDRRAGLTLGTTYKQGESVVHMKVAAGDHLFVDRVTYNFRAPERGEIVVFDTHGITALSPDQQDTFYIKRLVGLGDETLSLKANYILTNAPFFGTVPVGHLVVNGVPLSASTPHFENVYTFYGAARGAQILNYEENHYYGHALLQRLSEGNEFHIEPDHYFVMGDNTMNSSDSRYWGDFPKSQVIGKSFFVYWPITDRFGWNYR